MPHSLATLCQALVLLLILGSCTPRRQWHPPVPAGTIVEGVERQQVLAQLALRYERYHSLKSLARLRITRQDEKATLRLATVYSKPEDLRLELFPLHGFVSLSLLVAEGDKVTVLDQQEQRAYLGDDRLLRRALGISVNAEKAGTLLAGIVPLTSEQSNYLLYFDRATQRYTLVLRQHEVLWELAAESLAIQRSEFRDPFQGQLKAEVRYADYRKVGQELLPYHLELINTAEEQTFQIDYTHLEINSEIRAGLFEVSIPKEFIIHGARSFRSAS